MLMSQKPIFCRNLARYTKGIQILKDCLSVTGHTHEDESTTKLKNSLEPGISRIHTWPKTKWSTFTVGYVHYANSDNIIRTQVSFCLICRECYLDDFVDGIVSSDKKPQGVQYPGLPSILFSWGVVVLRCWIWNRLAEMSERLDRLKMSVHTSASAK